MSIQDFISQAASKIGAPSDAVESATGGLLGVIKDQAAAGDWSAITNAIPGADSLAKMIPQSESAASTDGGGLGGMLGGLAGKASSMMGGNGGALDIVGKLAGSGLDTSKLGGLASTFMDFVKEKAGLEVVGNILGKIPALKALIS